jgi:uncharacterized protein YhfF
MKAPELIRRFSFAGVKMTESAEALWRRYLESLGESEDTTSRTYTAWHFCDNEKDADELAELVCAGQKRATASALWVYEREKQPLPQMGDLSVILDWKGEARCIIQTTRIDILPFDEVSTEFAWTEGEGDRSLAHWREGHQRYFTRELEGIGMAFAQHIPVVCERFEVVLLA